MKLVNAYSETKQLFYGKEEAYAAEFLKRYVKPEEVTLEIHESNGYSCCPDLWNLLLVTTGQDFIDNYCKM